jgi:hypothetical protein
MQAYDDVDDAVLCVAEDAFARSRAAFDALVATLGSAEASGWAHDQLEDHLETGGRELLRLLFQDHLDLRAVRERHAVAQGRAGPVTDADGTCHRKVEHDHVRHLATVVGVPPTCRMGRTVTLSQGTPGETKAPAPTGR